jgi:hypothetical protein
VDQNTAFQYAIGTSTNADTLNQDHGGPKGSFKPSSTWALLGANSLAYSAAGTQIPEPGTAFRMGLGLLGLGLRKRSAQRAAGERSR